MISDESYNRHFPVVVVPKTDISRYVKGCSGKMAYRSRQEAIKRIRMQPNAAGLNAYRCDFCRGWHMGHKNPNFVKGEKV